MIESLLADLSALGWTISWAYQHSPDHWRVSIIKTESWNGYDQPAYHVSHCADAPSLAEAIEDAMSKMVDAEYVPSRPCMASKEPKQNSLADLISATFAPSAPIRRRV